MLAKGSIVQVNQGSAKDLYFALRGDGKNFGVVTRFDMQTYPNRPMWGGFSVHLPSDISHYYKTLNITHPLSFSLSSILHHVTLPITGLLCKLGFCESLSSFASALIEMYSDDDADAQGYGALLLLPYVRTYMFYTQLNHGGGLPNSHAFKPILQTKRLYSAHRLTNMSDFTKDNQGENADNLRGLR